MDKSARPLGLPSDNLDFNSSGTALEMVRAMGRKDWGLGQEFKEKIARLMRKNN